MWRSRRRRLGCWTCLGTVRKCWRRRCPLEEALSQRLRRRARALKVSAASLFHVAWAQVLARTVGSGGSGVRHGAVRGRMQGGEGADRALGLFINTLPVRLRLGVVGAQACVEAAHRTLTELLRHEHASLVLAQRCSSVPAPAPLFTALLNYRHSGGGPTRPFAGGGLDGWDGIEVLATEERTNYPLDAVGRRLWRGVLADGSGERRRGARAGMRDDGSGAGRIGGGAGGGAGARDAAGGRAASCGAPPTAGGMERYGGRTTRSRRACTSCSRRRRRVRRSRRRWSTRTSR